MFPRIIEELVDRFDRNKTSYKSSAYKEAQLRQEFINPFWEERQIFKGSHIFIVMRFIIGFRFI